MDKKFIALQNRQVVVATKHQKDAILSNVLSDALQWEFLPTPTIDTDQLGTFSGEIPRHLSPLEAAKAKIALLPANTNATIFIANEGTFTAHPQIPFLTANIELIYVYDNLNNWEFHIYHIDTEHTAFEQAFTQTAEALQIAEENGFPQQAMIITLKKNEVIQTVCKGLQTPTDLQEALRTVEQYDETYEKIISADLRAMYNPTRQKVIQRTAEKLLQALQTVCPQCNTPAFLPNETEKGLPCEWCGNPTDLVIKEISSCKSCAYTVTKTHTHKANPMYCMYCNP
jgi:hypothetical protein